MSFKPIPYYTNPKLADKVVQDLRVDFTNNLINWLTYCYPIAKVGIGSDGLKYPQIYANDGSNNHYDIRPDISIPSFGFFELNDSYVIDADEMISIYDISFICWFQIDKVDVGRDYDFTHDLISEVVGRLLIPKFKVDRKTITVDVNYENIFNKYNGLVLENKQFLMKPYGAFKLTFNIEGNNCYESFTPIGGTGCAGEQMTPCEVLLASLTDTQKNCLINNMLQWATANNNVITN